MCEYEIFLESTVLMTFILSLLYNGVCGYLFSLHCSFCFGNVITY